MAKRGVKKRDYEKLDDFTISKVVLLLEQDNPITKKSACEILNINYNVKRLGSIIEEYKDKLAFIKRRLEQNKGQPFSDLETKDIVISYLSSESISSIAKRIYRSVHTLKLHIKSLHLPERAKITDYRNPNMMPDSMVADRFKYNEYVWSARYNCVSQIKAELKNENEYYYRIYIFGKYMQFGYQPAFELGKLDILKKFKLNNSEFDTEQDFNMRIN